MSELYEKATPRPWCAHRTKGQTCSEISGGDGSWVSGPEMSDSDADLTCHAVNNIESLEQRVTALREALERYGRHDGLCAIIGGYGYCSCGLEKTRTALQNDGEGADPLIKDGMIDPLGELREGHRS